MDPKYQNEETFAGTVTDIDLLRRKAAGNDDWTSWKRILIASANSGRVLEQRMNDAEAAIEGKLARKETLNGHGRRIDALEAALNRGGGLLRYLWQIALILLTVYLTRRCAT